MEQQYRYEVLIGFLLSPQTKEQPIAQSFANLKQHGLTIDNIINTDAAVLDKLVYKCGFHSRKAVYVTNPPHQIDDTTLLLLHPYITPFA